MTEISLKGKYSNLEADQKKAWDEHFKKLVRCPNGTSHVSTTTEYFRYYETLKDVAMLFLGDQVFHHAKVAGSVAQNLKCESSNSKGDIDILVLSGFPAISPGNKDYVLVQGSDVGYCKIRAKKDDGKYPTVSENGAAYVKAASLRELDLAFWPKEFKPLMFVIDMLGNRTNLFNRYEQPENGAAIKISWSSSFSTLGTFDSAGMRLFDILIASYRANILPMLEEKVRVEIEEFFGIFVKITRVAVHYIESDVHMLASADSELPYEMQRYGILYFVMKYLSMNLQTKNIRINKERLWWLQSQCHHLKEQAERQVPHVDVRVETRHRKQGSFDIIPAISCEGFPEEAKNWPSRASRVSWPSQEIIEEIIKAGYQLVAKPSKVPGVNDAVTSFRYSFNDAENVLAMHLTEMQREVFRIFKMFFYENLQQDPKVLETYHLKTLFFWFLEETAKEIWIEENLAACSLALLEKLATALRLGRLDHYFIPEMNLFQYLEKDAMKDLAIKTEAIINNPISMTGDIMKSITKFYDQKIIQEKIEYNEFQTEQFFKEADGFYDAAVREIAQHEEVAVESGKKIEYSIANDAKMKSDDGLTGVLRFFSDLLFALRIEEKIRAGNLKNAGRKDLRISPILSFVLMFLPVVKDIIKTTPSILGRSQSKRWKKMFFIRFIARILFFLFNHNLIETLLSLVTMASQFTFTRNLPIHRLGNILNPFAIRRNYRISYGPTSQFLSFIVAGLVLVLFFCAGLFSFGLILKNLF